ncbi:MAG: nitrate reductase molybdenum cofactor assembly chaperone [Propionibacteriaceae bacterium]|jgi:nitrate reductase delta subunit|nr:nitrate reductase molybdenum cofactor assembly chaperone [Propionibacteriaceae bacterium]
MSQAVFGLASVLLGYPDAQLLALRPQLRQAVIQLPSPASRSQLKTFMSWFATESPEQLPINYVDTFDMKRATSMNLTYCSCGETRRRGQALLRLQQVLNGAGFQVCGDLPDNLLVWLEAASMDPNCSTELAKMRTQIEILRRGLEKQKSPYAHVVRAVLSELPEVDTELADELEETGPPTEEVGVECPLLRVAPQAAGPRDPTTPLKPMRLAESTRPTGMEA